MNKLIAITDYNKQATDFLESTQTILTWRFLRYGKYFPHDKENRLVWEFTLTRGGRKYVSTFGESTAETYRQLTGEEMPCYGQMTLYKEERLNRAVKSIRPDGSFQRPRNDNDWQYHPRQQLIPPSAYSLLACLEKYEPDPDVDTWAREYGYEIPQYKISEILKVHAACREQYLALCTLYSEEELSQLAEIN